MIYGFGYIVHIEKIITKCFQGFDAEHFSQSPFLECKFRFISHMHSDIVLT